MEFYNPVRLVLGRGVREKIAEECIDRSVLIFCTTSAFNRYKQDHALSALISQPNIKFEHAFDSNPSLSDIVEISRKYRQISLDLIIGLGGGSAMDVAKIASVSIPASQKGLEVDDLLSDPKLFCEFSAIDCMQVPTTAGTGSEVTPFATVWDYTNQQKKSLSNPAMFAKKAFIDPDFLIDMPFNVALSAGMDALNQAFESIWNRNTTPISLIYALSAARLCLESLPKLREMNSCPNTRGSLSEAGLYAGIAISQTRTSICHSISYPLTLKFSLPHGLACAFSMKEVYRFNEADIVESLITLGRSLGRNPYDLICAIYEDLEVESLISSYVAEPENIISMLDEMKTTGRFDNNIKACQFDDLEGIVNKSIERLLTLREKK
jgi:alcohol dehydrogenase